MSLATPPPLACLQGAHKRFGTLHALRGVDLQVHAGELVALLGRNGAGKSTSISLLLGLHQPDQGQALLSGRPAGQRQARADAGVMLQATGLPEALRVGELLDLTRRYYPQPRSVADCVALAGLEDLLARRYGQLSGGQQRRVQFALAICGRPRLLFLDEPTTGLDVDARQRLWRSIREMVQQGCGVLLTSHYLEEAEALADRVVVMRQGSVLLQGSVAEVRAGQVQARVRCRSVLEPAMVAAWPGVDAAAGVNGRLELTTACAEAVVARLLVADPALAELEVRRAGLAEAFLDIDAREAA